MVTNDKKIKTKITRFGYVINKKYIDDYELNKIKKDLTVTPFKLGKFNKFAKNTSFETYVENGDYIGIPKYYGLENIGEPDINKVNTYDFPVQNMEYTGKLRPHQEIVVEKMVKGFAEHGGGILVLGCGSGKTNIAIYLACKYKLRTLFVVHKTFLKNQVIDRIKTNTNVKEVGIIQSKTVKYKFPFVVGMVQSLSKIDYDDAIFKDFGMVIIDEVHHMGAKNFSKLYQKISTKYMLGISAEHNRNDGMYKIINWYMGPILHMEEQKPNDKVIVKRFNYKTSNKDRIKLIKNNFDEPNRSAMVTNLVYIKWRNRFILNLIKQLYDQGKNVLFLSGRLKQINLLYKLLNNDEYISGNVGKYVGGMTEDSLKSSSQKQIILGSYGMAEEGLDIENLNVVILGTPKSAIKQSVGRILRKEVYEEHPIVIDIIDIDNPVFKKQSYTREKYYKKQHYNIQNFDVADYDLKNYNIWNDDKFLSKALTQIPEKTSKKNNKKTKNNKTFAKPINVDDIMFMESDSE
ncbi:putative ATP-dependent RNA helicase [Megavirus lba]|uniref:Putative ATP-dependent RNA helicase n=1 Tax=Megavirus lba TaxID=1235314 RepID=L7XY86_9VIRU|nr:putative ATP-dependent RNA helicase [Megavirus lba]UAM96232.1 VV A18 helicase [Mimivirus sp.]